MKRHYMPVTADVPGVSEGQRALIRKVIRTALAAGEGGLPLRGRRARYQRRYHPSD